MKWQFNRQAKRQANKLSQGTREAPAVAFVKRNDWININPLPKESHAVSDIGMQGETC